jgi:allantoate deiminase
VLRRLEELFSIGAGQGASRPGLSPAEQQAHDLAAGWMTGAGLEVSADAAGNLVGRARGSAPQLGEVWTGSHLDTVPNGGRFDGALGVVAGLEAVAAAHARPHARTIAVVAFRDEEGCRFGHGYFGSRALCGLIEARELDVRDADGISVGQAVRDRRRGRHRGSGRGADPRAHQPGPAPLVNSPGRSLDPGRRVSRRSGRRDRQLPTVDQNAPSCP